MLFLLLCGASAVHGQKTRYGQEEQTPPTPKPAPTPTPSGYTLKVHVYASHLSADLSSLYVEATWNGMKYELKGDGSIVTKKAAFSLKTQTVLIEPGDYQAKQTVDFHNAANMIYREYELLLPDNSIWKGVVTGISE
jgi:hypothetical protein